MPAEATRAHRRVAAELYAALTRETASALRAHVGRPFELDGGLYPSPD